MFNLKTDEFAKKGGGVKIERLIMNPQKVRYAK